VCLVKDGLIIRWVHHSIAPNMAHDLVTCFCAISFDSVFEEEMTLMAVSSSRMLPWREQEGRKEILVT
jgi:hypothetical protein